MKNNVNTNPPVRCVKTDMSDLPDVASKLLSNLAYAFSNSGNQNALSLYGCPKHVAFNLASSVL